MISLGEHLSSLSLYSLSSLLFLSLIFSHMGRCHCNVTGWDRSHGLPTLSCVWQDLKLSDVSLGARPRYSLIVDEDIKKQKKTKQTLDLPKQNAVLPDRLRLCCLQRMSLVCYLVSFVLRNITSWASDVPKKRVMKRMVSINWSTYWSHSQNKLGGGPQMQRKKVQYWYFEKKSQIK